jgi:hypothetical protein
MLWTGAPGCGGGSPGSARLENNNHFKALWAIGGGLAIPVGRSAKKHDDLPGMTYFHGGPRRQGFA